MGQSLSAIGAAFDAMFANWTIKFLKDIDLVAAELASRSPRPTVLITGPTSGIGRQTATRLFLNGHANLVLACRNVAKGEALRGELVAAWPGADAPTVEVQELDVSSLASVRSFAKSWSSSGRPLDVLVCNAGMDDFGEAPRAETAEGFEVHLATNYLGHALLTRLLVPNLLAGGAASRHVPRVVMVTSLLHFLGRIDKGDVNLLKGYDHRRAYTQSKLFQVLFAAELAHRTGGRIFAVSVHPGLVATDIARGASAEQRKKLASFERMAIPAAQGCRSSLVAVASEKLVRKAGEDAQKGPVYLHWTGGRRKASPAARDRTLQTWAWNWTAEAVGLPRELDGGANAV